MTEIAVLGDSHVPSRAQRVPERVRDEVREADKVVHVGDFDTTGAYDDFSEWASELVAVSGNMDPRMVDLPETVGFEVEGVRFAVSHGTGPKRGYEDRVARVGKEKDADVSVAGHTHEVLDTTVEGVRLLNPGSCTGAPPATETTMMRVVVDEGEIDVETIRL